MSNIEKKRYLDNSKLDSSDYVNSLLGQALSNALITTQDTDRIQRALIDLLYVTCTRFTGGDSSSVRVEIANELANSCMYQIGLALRASDDAEKALDQLLNTPLKDLYKRGHDICEMLCNDTKRFYTRAKTSAIRIHDQSYKNVIKAVGSYLTHYSTDFFAARVPGDIDYPLFCPVDGVAGIEYANEYLLRFNIENAFCRCFPVESIENLIRSYSGDTDDMYINVYELVLVNAIGCTLAGRDVFSLSLDKGDIEYLSSRFAGMDINRARALIEEAYGMLCGEIKHTAGTSKAYFLTGVGNIASRCIRNASGVFLREREVSHESFVYTAAKPMDRSAFGALVNLLYSLDDVKSKVDSVNGEIESIYDFVDIASSDCFEESEIPELLASLDEMSLGAVLKLVSDYSDGVSTLDKAIRAYLNTLPDMGARAVAISQRLEIKQV